METLLVRLPPSQPEEGCVLIMCVYPPKGDKYATIKQLKPDGKVEHIKKRKRPAVVVKNAAWHCANLAGSCQKLVTILLTSRKLSSYSSFWKKMEASYKATAIDRYIDRNAVEIR